MARHYDLTLQHQEPQVLGPEQRIALLEARLEQQSNRIDPARVAIMQMRYILFGTLAIVAMLCSFAWSALEASLKSADKQSERAHELAMAAVEASKAQVPAYSPEMIFFYGLLAVASMSILLGILKRLTGK